MMIIGYIFMGLGIVCIAFGVYGIFRFNDFYSRILVASKVDTVGLVTLLIGAMLVNGNIYFSLKIMLIIVIAIMTNPLISHSIARSAYLSGYRIKKGEEG
ncbi:monovalent cation/proton antiporter, MnhG/PhaG subunit [Alkaliphilus metalliredigens QYMF]|uniref:Monovalent cation/proton antiporter, MnhG/PhaG subunit n=1 Tax=Alkaliphilus metalliredigens (strain QYMF) TaxID=293826 RepID=A6TMD7_ALKMQ|nr:monovalent cation/H(+) antiporter subunit G [Alkaliphilus metalliredigens]ABR47355.1 monovalent cation/proton antiporter, MnhG/PhaG subunit [Alkaliphilus metalliredigens QYMF]